MFEMRRIKSYFKINLLFITILNIAIISKSKKNNVFYYGIKFL